MRWRVAILTTSDRGVRGERETTNALVIRELVEEELHGEIVDERVIPEEIDEMMAALIEMTDYYQAHLIITTGGSQLHWNDITPEATRQVIDREVPGFPEIIRQTLRADGLAAATFRGIAGLREQSLILNLPDSPLGVSKALLALIPDIETALLNIQGRVGNDE